MLLAAEAKKKSPPNLWESSFRFPRHPEKKRKRAKKGNIERTMHGLQGVEFSPRVVEIPWCCAGFRPARRVRYRTSDVLAPMKDWLDSLAFSGSRNR
jgi:hypothetical protein